MTKWTISRLEDSDLQRCSDINIAAFDSSGDWTAEERAASERRRFQPVLKRIAAKATNEFGEIGAYAAWQLKPSDSERSEDTYSTNLCAIQDPEVDTEAMARYQIWVKGHLERIMAGRQHWDLTALATDPQYARQGAASALLRWGLERAAEQGLPTIFGAVPEAVPVYMKAGFEVVEKIKLDYEDRDAQGRAQGQRTIELVIMTKQV